MAKKKRKEVEDKKDSGRSDDSNLDNNKKIYEVKSLDDYFFIVRDVFSDFKSFINDTNDVLNTALGAVKEIVPMIINGDNDYEKVFRIIDNINSVLKDYVDKQNNLIRKISNASDILSKDIRWDRLILDMIYGSRLKGKTTEGDQENQIIKANELIPSFSIKDNEKIIEEIFGVRHIEENGREEKDEKEGEDKD